MNQISLVIFDDNDEIRNGLIQLLRLTPGIHVAGAYSNCMEAAVHADNLKPDVILMDIDMPGQNGIEGVKQIKKVRPQVEIIMLTVFEDEDRIFDSMRAGASGYLLKKSPPSKIIEAIREASMGGAPMTSSIAKKVVQYFSGKGKEKIQENNLSPRELEVLKCLVDGLSYKMIAAELCIGIETVRTHIKRIYEKLQVNSNTEAVSKAIRGNFFS
jgi:DNA-binding NarL/FixJ family response regulator